MDKFLNCLCFKKYNVLIKSGAPTEDEILAAWYLIISEYNELKNIDISENKYWSISQDLIRLHSHLFLLQTCIDTLKVTYNESIAQSLRKLGYRFKYVSDNPSDYIDQLFKIAEKAKTKYVLIQQCHKQLKEISEKQTDVVPEYGGFEKRLVEIEEMQHTSYDFSTLTVSKFISLENKYRDMITALELKASKK